MSGMGRTQPNSLNERRGSLAAHGFEGEGLVAQRSLGAWIWRTKVGRLIAIRPRRADVSEWFLVAPVSVSIPKQTSFALAPATAPRRRSLRTALRGRAPASGLPPLRACRRQGTPRWRESPSAASGSLVVGGPQGQCSRSGRSKDRGTCSAPPAGIRLARARDQPRALARIPGRTTQPSFLDTRALGDRRTWSGGR
jgi:hypothetical protein